MKLKKNILQSVNELYDILFNKNKELEDKNNELEQNYLILNNKYKRLDTEFKNFKKVSLVQ